MTSTEQQNSDSHPSTPHNYVIDIIDAQAQARDVTKNFSAIFQMLMDFEDHDLCNERIPRLLYRTGFYYATEQLSLLEEQISETQQVLDEMKAKR